MTDSCIMFSDKSTSLLYTSYMAHVELWDVKKAKVIGSNCTIQQESLMYLICLCTNTIMHIFNLGKLKKKKT